MTAAELKAARIALGLKAAELGRRLELEGDDPGRSVRLWEAGRKVPGPAAVAVRYMLEEKARQGLQDAQEALRQAEQYPNAPIAFSDPNGPDMRPLHQRVIHTRRRGQ